MTLNQFKKFLIEDLVNDAAVAMIEERNQKGGSMVIVLDDGSRFSMSLKKLKNIKH